MTSTWPTRQTLLQVEPWVWRRWFRWNWYRQHKKSTPFIHIRIYQFQTWDLVILQDLALKFQYLLIFKDCFLGEMHIDPNWFTSTSTSFVGENLKSHVFPDLSIKNFGTFDVDFEGHVASSCMVCWFTFSSCVPWKRKLHQTKKTHKCYNTPFFQRLIF